MRRLFGLMSDQVQATGQQLQTWWATLSPDPRSWLPFTWVLAGIVVVIVLILLLRPRRRVGPRRPELLISHGELRVAGPAAADAASSLHAPANAVYDLGMTVSNLSASPVQLLELAVRTNRASAATAAEVAAVLPPHGAVDVTAELQDAAGDEGVLELFVYVPDMPPKTFRVRARLLWEPWNARYRVLPLDQRVDVARGVSERVQRRRQATAWRRAAAGPSSGGPSTVGASRGAPATARRPGAPAYSDEGRFAPRPEFTEPRNAARTRPHEAARDVPQREPPSPYRPDPLERPERPGRGGPEDALPAHGQGPRVPGPSADTDRPTNDRPANDRPANDRPASDQAANEETWPSSRPPRDAHRARPARPEPARPEPARPEPRSEPARPEAQRREAEQWPAGEAPDRRSAGAPRPGGAPEERAAWRLGDAERFSGGEAGRSGGQGGERPSERAGQGRAARAARGTDRDGPGSPDGTRAPRDPGRGGSGRVRRWAVRADAPQRDADLGPGELVGPDEETPAPEPDETEQPERARPKLEFPDEF